MFLFKRRTVQKESVKPNRSSTTPGATSISAVPRPPPKASDKPTDSYTDHDKPEGTTDSQWTKPFDESDPFSSQPSEASSRSTDDPSTGYSTDGPTADSSDPSDSASAVNDEGEAIYSLKDLRHQTINVKFHSDVHTPQITGCCFMPGGELVICDYRNQLIKSFSKTFSNTGNLSLPVGPFGVAVLDQNNCIVTMPGQKQLQLIQVLPSLQLASTINVRKECWGVAVAGDNIFVTCYTSELGHDDGEIRLYGKIGNLVNSLRIYQIGEQTIRRLDNLAVNRTGDKIFFPDWETDTLSCINPEGTLVYQHKNSELESPRGLYVDGKGNVIICGHEGKCVQVVTADGQKHKMLLSKTFYDPCSIAFRPEDGTLVIGCSRSDEMFYYKLKMI